MTQQRNTQELNIGSSLKGAPQRYFICIFEVSTNRQAAG
jgi:hypothetical protein